MRTVFKENKFFLVPYFTFLVLGAVVLLWAEKTELHLFFNKLHHPVADYFFQYLTYLGDGIVVISITVLYLFIRIRHGLLIFLSYAVSALGTQLLKHTLFSGSLRPIKFFKELDVPIRIIPGVEPHGFNSFPSGHASAAFTLFFCLGLITKSHFLKITFFVLSVLAAYSRVYLSQHFFGDIYAGSIIGVGSAIIIWYWMERSRQLHEKEWLEKSLLSLK